MFIIDPFPPRPAKASLFVILLCLSQDNFSCQGRASAWEKVVMRTSTCCTINIMLII